MPEYSILVRRVSRVMRETTATAASPADAVRQVLLRMGESEAKITPMEEPWEFLAEEYTFSVEASGCTAGNVRLLGDNLLYAKIAPRGEWVDILCDAAEYILDRHWHCWPEATTADGACCSPFHDQVARLGLLGALFRAEHETFAGRAMAEACALINTMEDLTDAGWRGAPRAMLNQWQMSYARDVIDVVDLLITARLKRKERSTC